MQVAGRGRAGNVWLSPVGQLSFSTAVQHPPGSLGRAPVMFIQYLAALAVVQGIRDYDRGYEDLPVRLKWPNDICRYYVELGGGILWGATTANRKQTRSIPAIPTACPIAKSAA